MSRRCRYSLAAVASFLIFFTATAQDLDSVPPVIIHDTAYENTPASAPDYSFKQVTGPGKVDTRNVSGGDFQKLKSDKDYWYVNETPPRNRKDRNTSTPAENQKGAKEPGSHSFTVFSIPWLNVIFWIVLIGGFIALLTWFLATSNISLFKKKAAQAGEEAEEDTGENIFEMNFERAVLEAVDAKNYTLAVRLMYLQTLRHLSERNIINYTHEKTNSDYLFQLANTRYYKTFFKLTRSFEYTWYGKFELSADSFSLIRNDFSTFEYELSR